MEIMPKGLEEAFKCRFFDALWARRSRRFGMGMEIDQGPLKYKSKYDPVPLTELEEALIAWSGAGIKSINLSDFPPHVGLDLEFQFTSKALPSLGDIHRTELFYTNDEGTYMIRLADQAPGDFKGLEDLSDEERVDKVLELFRESRIEVEDGRASLPTAPPGMSSHNLWNVNKPGTTVFMPVTDITAGIINLFFFYMRPDHRYNFIDELHGGRLPGTDRWVKEGFIREEMKMPLIDSEVRFANGYIAEQAFGCQNMMLALQAMGLGGWLFSGFVSMFILGGTPLYKGLGFRFVTPKKGMGNPIAVGKDGLFQAFCPPYYDSMDEAVEAFHEMKWSNWKKRQLPYKEPEKVLTEVPRPTDKEIQVVKDICNYIYDTYGRFPALVDPMYIRFMVQGHHLDLEFYDNFYPSGAYTDFHRRHFELWHPEISLSGEGR